MAKKMLIDATHAEETRVVVVDGNKVEEFDFESDNKRQLAGNIYLAKVTRVEPSLQAAFVDYGGNRHGFLAFSEIHPDYYQIPVADREALMEEERAYAEAMKARDEAEEKKPSRSRRRSSSRSKAARTDVKDAVETKVPAGMETIELEGDDAVEGLDDAEGLSPMETVAAVPVEEGVESAEAPVAAEADEDMADEAPARAAEFSTDDEEDGDDEDDAASEIESVAEEDDEEDIRPPRKPRPRKYKIQEVIKVRQILLVQVVKEERGNKGAALTTYLSLAGRYCVLMPNTARGGGISRKITNAADRKKLKEIAAEIDVPTGAGLIVRTAGAKRTKTEIKRDYEYLQRLWEQIRELTLKSIAPAKIYEEGDLIKRSIRDLYSREIDEVLVEGERGYRNAKDFMKMIMPSHAKNVKNYQEAMPLFARYQVESYLSGMFNPTVQLKSGGYIVIGVTEALVAIDVNSGRATKEGSIEETALKTNLEAAEEVARQLRLRDLAGLIVIDFIDMDERKNNAAVEKKLKDKLKTDRARIQVGRISGFGLLEMSRQRLRPGMIEATTQPCPACHGTGLIRSDDNMALNILRQIEEEGTRRRSREVLVKCPVGIANYLMNQKREHVAQIELRYGMSVRIEGEPHLVSPDFTMEKFKTATRSVPEATAPVVSVNALVAEDFDEPEIEEDEIEEAEEAETTSAPETPEGDEEQKPKKRRRRRRRRKSSSGNGDAETGDQGDESSDDDGSDEAEDSAAEAEADAEAAAGGADAEVEAEAEEKPKKSSRSRSRSRSRSKKSTEGEGEAQPEAEAEATGATKAEPEAAEAEPKPKAPRKRTVSRKKKTEDAPVAEAGPEAASADQNAPEVKAPVAAEDAAEQPADLVAEAGDSAGSAAPLSEEAGATTPVAEAEPEVPETDVTAAEAAPVAEAETTPEPQDETVAAAEEAAEPVAEETAPTEEAPAEPAVEETAEAPAEPQPEPVGAGGEAEEDDDKPKRRGWWSIGR
ncbi:Rne/Rng family ribonuclease [Mesobacterium pallidum]|uniref:Rne/Rng family ribonuclease n=1 Tax=Mesobacterium pallidum TaxID=2872037 RepID=UPI001EE30FF0|nr:ribonuclease E/G [Mesobacterium pallidum]